MWRKAGNSRRSWRSRLSVLEVCVSMNSTDVLYLLVRITAVLAAGWIALLCLKRANPRWTVLIARCMILAVMLLPLLMCAMPEWTIAALPPVAEEQESVRTNARLSPEPERLSVLQDAAAHDEVTTWPPVPLPELSSLASSIEASNATDSAANELSDDVTPIATTKVETDDAPVPASDTAIGPALPSPAETGMRGAVVLAVVWLGITAVLLLRLLVQGRRSLCCLRTCVPASPSLQAIAEEVGAEVGVSKRRLAVLLSSDLSGPCTIGWRRPTVVLPQQWAEAASLSELSTVIAHELSHVAGRDGQWDILARTVQALLWFHPLIWVLPRHHRLACEYVSDATAAGVAGSKAAYRQSLAGWALKFHEDGLSPIVLSMASRSSLSQRLEWLTQAVSARVLSRTSVYGATTVVVLLLIVASVVSIVRAEPVSPAAIDDNLTPDETPAVTETDQNDVPVEPAPNRVTEQSTPDQRLFSISIVDEDGAPVPDAEVALTGWKHRDGRSFYVAIEYEHVDRTGRITLKLSPDAIDGRVSVRAPGFAKIGQNFTFSGSGTVVLKRGRVITVRAVDADGELIDDAWPLLEGASVWGQEFTINDDEHFVSPVLTEGRRWMRVVAVRRDGPMLFSDLIDVTDPDAADAGVITVSLTPGLRLRGTLDEKIPRPIVNGFVELCIAEGEGHCIPETGGFQWSDAVPVQPDGTFEFSSVPSGGHAQLFVLVDGYQSRLSSVAELREYSKQHDAGGSNRIDRAEERSDAILPQLFPLVDPDGGRTVEVQIPCIPTTNLTVNVVDSFGQGIADAEVSFNPNGLFLGGGLFIPGTSSTMAAMVQGKSFFDRGQQLKDWLSRTALAARTDERGVASIPNLPGVGRESFEVKAEGFVMPLHPLATADHPFRSAMVELKPGAVLRRTVTMETDVQHTEREVMIIDSRGRPLPGITLTVLEVGFVEAPEDWQSWSVQRFGSVARAESSEEGKAVIRLPERVDGKQTAQFRVNVEGEIDRIRDHGRTTPSGRLTRNAMVRERLTIPLQDDGRLIVATVSESPPKEENRAYWSATAEYADPGTVIASTPEELVKQLAAQPTLVVLQRLLVQNEYAEGTVLELRAERNLVRMYDEGRSPVEVIPCDDGERLVVLCRIRPADANWSTKPPLNFAPEAAFVFDADSGELIVALGGGQSSSGSYDNVTLLNLGGGDDYFVWVSRFERREVNAKESRWYRVSRAEDGPSMTIHQDANGNAFDAREPTTPLPDFGYLEYVSKGRRMADRVLGESPEGVAVPRRIYWDIARDRFLGPVMQTHHEKSLYRVIVEESPEFTAFEPGSEDIIVGGGRRAFEDWYLWHVVVPDEALVRLVVSREQDDGIGVEEVLVEERLVGKMGHKLQLLVDPEKQTDQSSLIHLYVDIKNLESKQGKYELTVPRLEHGGKSAVPDQPVLRTARESDVLWRQDFTDNTGAGKIELRVVVP